MGWLSTRTSRMQDLSSALKAKNCERSLSTAVVNNVEIMGTGRVSRNTSKIIAYAFAKEDVKEENLTFITITATDVAQQKTVVTENGIFYFYVKDDKGDIYRSNKLEISDISDISDINSSAQ